MWRQLQQLGVILFQRNIGFDGDQRAVQGQNRQRRTQVLADLAGELFGIGDDRLQRAVFGQPFRGGFRSAFFDAFDVVDGVAHQCQKVDDLVGAYAEFFRHTFFIGHAAGHGVGQGDVRSDQLREILVTGGNHHVHAVLGRLHGIGADDIVGFHAGHADDRQTKRLHDGDHRLDLCAQIIGHGGAVGFVLGIQRIAEGRAGRIQHERDVLGIFLQAAFQHVDDAEQRTGRRAIAGGQRRQRMEGAVQIGRAVDEDEFGHDRNPS